MALLSDKMSDTPPLAARRRGAASCGTGLSSKMGVALTLGSLGIDSGGGGGGSGGGGGFGGGGGVASFTVPATAAVEAGDGGGLAQVAGPFERPPSTGLETPTAGGRETGAGFGALRLPMFGDGASVGSGSGFGARGGGAGGGGGGGGGFGGLAGRMGLNFELDVDAVNASTRTPHGTFGGGFELDALMESGASAPTTGGLGGGSGRLEVGDAGGGGGGGMGDDVFSSSFKMSKTGTYTIDGFVIAENGIQSGPAQVAHRHSSMADGAARVSIAAAASAPAAAAAPGNLRDEMIRVSVLGQGASGKVYKAIHVPTMQLLAAKVIPAFDAEKRRQMTMELKLLWKLLRTRDAGSFNQSPCPYVVAFYDAFANPQVRAPQRPPRHRSGGVWCPVYVRVPRVQEGSITIIVEYMDGGSLQDIVDTGGCQSEPVLANISWRVLQGLAFLHENRQVHRDIKPSNLLINHRGNVKVSDFGIVREIADTQEMAKTFVGTLTYMSPERIRWAPRACGGAGPRRCCCVSGGARRAAASRTPTRRTFGRSACQSWRARWASFRSMPRRVATGRCCAC